MNKMNKKKILAMLLSLVMLSLVISIPVYAENDDSGTCGDNLTWTLDDTGLLTISGTGKMMNYSSAGDNAAPWYVPNTETQKVKKVIIENGVTSIGDWAFDGCDNLTSIIIIKETQIC